jgi:hypothetical protein
MNHYQKTQNEIFFKKVLNHTKENGIYFYPNENALYTIVDGKFKPHNSKSRKAMVAITGKTFQENFMVK